MTSLVAASALLLATTSGGVRSAGAAVGVSTSCAAPAVAVVVDFSRWNESATRVCVPWSDTLTGSSLLHAAGFTTTGTVHDGPGFICRIGFPSVRAGTQFPTSAAPDDEACVLTPPASAYWAYWHADPGSATWTFSQLGSMSYHPKPGSVDAWTFGTTDIGGDTGQPSFSPAVVLPAAASVVPTPPTSASETRPGQGSSDASPDLTGPDGSNHGTGATGGTASANSGSTTRGASRLDAPTTPWRSGTGTSPDGGSRLDDTGTNRTGSAMAVSESVSRTGEIRTVDAVRVAGRPPIGGSPIPTMLTVGIAALLAAAGVRIERSRTRRGASAP